MPEWPSGWTPVRLGDAGKWLSGGTPATSRDEFWHGDIPWISSGSLTEFRITRADRYVTELGARNGTRLVGPGTVVMVVRGMSLKTEFRLGITRRTVAFGQDCKALVPREGIDPEFLAYAIAALTPDVLAIVDEAGHGTGRLNSDQLYGQRVGVPGVREQRAIADVLGALDDKIAANERVVGLLLDLMAGSYEAALHRGSASVELDDVAEFHNRRRVPLSAREREGRPGRVPYYGATGVFGHVDEALFNGVYLLVGEDGSVITDSGKPVVQYIWGPAWVNNHAHVLAGNGVSTELLRFAISRADVRHLVTGAVQPKISMGKLRSLRLDMPSSELRASLEDILREHSAALRARTDEISILSKLRDTLLPQLMSGKIRVKDAERAVSEVV